MSPVSGPLLGPVAGAAARTAAAGTARLLAAWCTGSPLPEAADRRCEGVANLARRRARVSQSLFFTDGAAAALAADRDDGRGAGDLSGCSEVVYDGANAYVRVGGSWTGFFLADPGGPRGPNDPLWPLDAAALVKDERFTFGRWELAQPPPEPDAAEVAWLDRLAELTLDDERIPQLREQIKANPAFTRDGVRTTAPPG